MNPMETMMTTITSTTPQLEYSPPQDEWDSQIGDLLIAVGRCHLSRITDGFTDWLTIAQVTDLCRRYLHKSRNLNYRVKELQPLIIALFDGRDSIVRDGVKVRYESREEHPRYARTSRTVHCLRFYKANV